MTTEKIGSLARITTALENIQAYIGGFFLFVLLFVVLMDVLFRELGTPLVWVQNIAGFAFIWVVFFGGALGIKKGTHYTIQLFPHPGPTLRKLMDVAIFVCELIFVAIFIVCGFDFALMSIKRLVMPSGVSMFFAAIAIPLAGLFMLAYVAEAIINSFAKQRGGEK